jgi:D-alanine-D-alanine ligase
MLFVDFPDGVPHIVDYAAKWDAASHAYHHTPRRFGLPAEDGPLVAALRALALRAWDLFGLRGYARVDFRVDAAGRPFMLEVNANPCLAPDAGFMAAAAQAGYDASAVIERLTAPAQAAPAAAAPVHAAE